MASVEGKPCKKLKFIKVKRKASDDHSSSPLIKGNNAKRFKFLGSAVSGDDDTIKELISNNSEINVVEESTYEISDLVDFIAKYRQRVKQFPKPKEGMYLGIGELIYILRHIFHDRLTNTSHSFIQ